MKRFMLIISILALIESIATLFIINIKCPPHQTLLNVFFGITVAFSIWIVAIQIQEMREA